MCDVKIKPEIDDSDESADYPDVDDSVTVSYISGVIDMTQSKVLEKPASRSSARLRNRKKPLLDASAVSVKKEVEESENASTEGNIDLTTNDNENFTSQPTSAGRTVRKVRARGKKVSIVRHDNHSNCPTCLNAPSTSARFRRHQHTHVCKNTLKCKFCSLVLPTPGQLQKHQSTHNFERPFKCQFCVKAYKSAAYLREHVRVHTGERPFQCAFCVKTFITTTCLRVHERIHTGERPYKCRFCDKAFATNCVMRAHERIHTGEKPYKCSLCSRAFTKSGHLRRHENIHANIKTLHLNKNLFFVL